MKADPERWSIALDLAGVGSWELDVAGGTLPSALFHAVALAAVRP